MKKKTRIEERNTQETVFSILTQPIDLFYYILSGHSTSISHHRQGSRIAITTRDWMRRGCVGAAPDRILSRAGQMVPSQLEEPVARAQSATGPWQPEKVLKGSQGHLESQQ